MTSVSEEKHRRGNSVATLSVLHITKLTIYIAMHKQKVPIYKLSPQQNTKTASLRLQTWEKPVDFFHEIARASTLVPTIILLTWLPFAKVSIPVEFIIPWYVLVIYWESSVQHGSLKFINYLSAMTMLALHCISLFQSIIYY